MIEIKNLKNLVKRILKALKAEERIILYGDSDMDGATAIIILKEALNNLGAKAPVIYFSDRKKTKQGINKEGLKLLKKQAPALLITLDCGTSNAKEIKLAQQMGFEVAVVDHHDISERLPAKIIVNPKQGSKSSRYYFLATAGLAFEIAKELLGKKLGQALKEDILSMAALGTIIDLAPETGENRKILKNGLPLLETSWRPAVKALFACHIVKNCISTREIAAKIGRVINITEKKDDYLSKIYVLLNAQTEEEANLHLEELLQTVSERQERISFFMQKLKDKILTEGNSSPIIFKDLPNCPLPILSVVASRTSNFFMKPAFIFTKEKEENWGSYRMPFDENGIGAVSSCAKLLTRYGGHRAVGGFYFKDKNKDKIKKCLLKYFNNQPKLIKKSA